MGSNGDCGCLPECRLPSIRLCRVSPSQTATMFGPCPCGSWWWWNQILVLSKKNKKRIPKRSSIDAVSISPAKMLSGSKSSTEMVIITPAAKLVSSIMKLVKILRQKRIAIPPAKEATPPKKVKTIIFARSIPSIVTHTHLLLSPTWMI